MRTFAFSLGLIPALIFAGCASEPQKPAAAPPPTAPSAALDPAVNSRAIAKGMTADEVVRRIGKPAEVRPLSSSDGHAEIWVYRRNAGQKTVQTATSTRQIPIPSASGEIRMVDEPVFSLEQITLEESVSLLMYDGKLVEWRKSVEGKRSFN